MDVNRLQQQKKVNIELDKTLEQSLEDWFEHELSKVIDEEIQKLQTTEDVEVAFDMDSLEETKKNIANAIKSCYQ